MVHSLELVGNPGIPSSRAPPSVISSPTNPPLIPPDPESLHNIIDKKYRKTILINIRNIHILQKLIYPIFWDHLIVVDPPPPGHLDNAQEVHLFSFQLSCHPVTQDVTCPHPQAPNKQILDPAPPLQLAASSARAQSQGAGGQVTKLVLQQVLSTLCSTNYVRDHTRSQTRGLTDATTRAAASHLVAAV